MSDFITLAISSDFAKRGECGNWHPGFVWLYVLSQALIFAAYMAIPFVLLVRKQHVPAFQISRNQITIMRWTFGAFIFLCGIGHLEGVVAFFRPHYHLYAIWHCLTAMASWAAVCVAARMRYRLIPGI